MDARGFVNVPAERSAYGARTASEFHCDSVNGSAGHSGGPHRDSFGLGVESRRNRSWSWAGDRSDLLDVERLENNCVTVPPSNAGTTADSDDSELPATSYSADRREPVQRCLEGHP